MASNYPVEAETLEEQIERVLKNEDIAIVPYDSRWPELFREEKEHLLAVLPKELIRRIEQFGSTAIPGLGAKPCNSFVRRVGVSRRQNAPSPCLPHRLVECDNASCKDLLAQLSAF